MLKLKKNINFHRWKSEYGYLILNHMILNSSKVLERKKIVSISLILEMQNETICECVSVNKECFY